VASVTLDGGQSSSAIGGQTIDYIVTLILQEMNGVPDGLARSKLQLVMREFYTRSTGWRETVGPYVVAANIDEFDLNPVDQNSSVQFVHAAWLLGITAPGQRAPRQVSQRLSQDTQTGTPRVFFTMSPSKLQLAPIPDRTYGRVFYAYCTLIPTAGATVLPDISFTHHLDALMSGTMARLYSMPKKPWSDKELASYHDRKYRQEITIWRDFALRAQGPGDMPFRFPSFANSPGQQLRGGGVVAGP
jgi:hypothetical protein